MGSKSGSRDAALNVLVLHWGNSGGGPKYAYDIAKALQGLPNTNVFVSYSLYADNADNWNGFGAGSMPVRTYQSAAQYLLRLPMGIIESLKLRSYIKRNKITVVYSAMNHMWHSLFSVLIVPRNVVYAASVHDARPHIGEGNIVANFCQFNVLRSADILVAHSDHVRDELVKAVQRVDRIHVVPMGMDSPTSSPRKYPVDRTLIVGFFGRIVAYKGLDLFVEALSILRTQGIAVNGAVFGNGSVEKSLVENSADYIDWNIRWIDGKEIPRIFGQFDILILPYIEASQSGIVSIAAGHGVPMVATPIGALPEQVGLPRLGVVSQNTTAESVAAAISDLISNPVGYEAASRAGIEFALEEGSWLMAGRRLRSAITS